MRAPARSSVMVRSITALPSFTCAIPDARSDGGPSSRSSRAVTVSSSHASPPRSPPRRAGEAERARPQPRRRSRGARLASGGARARGRDCVDGDAHAPRRGHRRARIGGVLRGVVQPAVADDDHRRGALGAACWRAPGARFRGRCAAPAAVASPSPALSSAAARRGPRRSRARRTARPGVALRTLAIAASRASRRGRSPSSVERHRPRRVGKHDDARPHGALARRDAGRAQDGSRERAKRE